MQIAIVKYNAGNIQSLSFALNRLGITPILSNSPEILASADKVIFPGVGEASSAMRSLKENKLDQFLPTLKQPFLGICLGMQLMCSHSEENDTSCLSIFEEKVVRFISPGDTQIKYKVPHMGWNKLYNLESALFQNLTNEEYAYFVHSYYVEQSEHTIATCNYTIPFAAAIQKDNFYALQFHPEKSANAGVRMLENFLNIH